MCGRSSFSIPSLFRKDKQLCSLQGYDKTYYGTIDASPRFLYERRLRQVYTAPPKKIKVSAAYLKHTSGPSFDKEKLKKKIQELRTVVEENDNFFPSIHVHDGEDIEPFTMATFLSVGTRVLYEPCTLRGWLGHTSEESFRHSCEVIASQYGVKPELVEAAIWLMSVYYMDGEDECNGIDICSFDMARELYGIRDVETFAFMNYVYGDMFYCDIAKLAMLLDA